MTPTPEAVEAAAVALAGHDLDGYPGELTFDDLTEETQDYWRSTSTVALTAALPLLLDQLIAEAETPKVLTRDMISRDQAWRELVAYLRAQKGTANDQ